MPKLVWDKIGERTYETGVDRGVLYPQAADGTYPKGVAWSGLTSVAQKPSGAEPSKFYADNIEYLNLLSAEEFAATIGAYMYPDEFAECDGSASLVPGVTIGQQPRKAFGFSYRTLLGNDTEDTSHGYKLHLVYGAKASPSEKTYNTMNDSPEPLEMSWEVSTTPVTVTGHKPTSIVEIDSTTVDAAKLAALETILYGSEDAEPRLPLPDEVATLMGKN